ncbi:MAG: phage terminase large subunit family protein [Halobacteriota archaeon]
MSSWFPGDGSFELCRAEQLRKKNAEAFELPLESDFVTYYIGVDLGLKRDPSAVAIVQRLYAPSRSAHYFVQWLHRFPLRTPYTDIAAEVAHIDDQLKVKARIKGKQCEITYALDATGVGQGVTELVAQAMPNATIMRCYLTGGITPATDWDLREVRIPKGQMVSTLIALFDANRLHLSKRSKEIDAMVTELENFELHLTDEGKDTYGAKIGKHDDLVCALGLACFVSAHVYNDNANVPLLW